MTKELKKMLLDDFHNEIQFLECEARKGDWKSSTRVISFCTSDGLIAEARYSLKDQKFIEISVISEQRGLEYIKL